MIKQALNAPTIAGVMSRFAKDDAIKLLGKSIYNKWLKKLPTNSIANNTTLPGYDGGSDAVMQMTGDVLRAREAARLQRAQDVSNELMYRYGPSFEANLPRVNERQDTRGRLKGAVLEWLPRVNYLNEFAKRNSLVSRDELLRWNRNYKAGLDPKTLTSEWYVKPKVGSNELDTAHFLREPLSRYSRIFYNEKYIPDDTAYHRAQTVRDIAAVPYTDPIRHTASQLVATELNRATNDSVLRKAIYNSVSDNTRKALNYINGRNVLEDPRALRLMEAANKHGRLNIDIAASYKNGTNAAFFPEHNILAVHPKLAPDIKNHEHSHYLLHNMDAQEHANVAGRAFRGINAISRKNPEYSDLAKKLINHPREAHEAVTDYYRHKLHGTSISRADEIKELGLLNADVRVTEPAIDHVVSETQNLTSNPSLQQALQQLAINYGIPLRNEGQLPELVLELANLAMR